MAWLRLAAFICICFQHFCRAAFTPDQQALCSIAIANTVEELSDAGVRIWNAVQQCNFTLVVADKGTSREEADRRITASKMSCASDIGQVLVPLAATAQYILTIVGDCGHVNIPMSGCIEEALELAGAIADLSSYAISLNTQCVQGPDSTVGEGVSRTSCVLNVNDALDSVLELFASASEIQEMCRRSATYCAESVSQGVAEFANVARYVLASIEDCSENAFRGTFCGAEVAGLIAASSEIVSNSLGVQRECSHDGKAAKKSFKGMTMSMAVKKAFSHVHIPTSHDTKDALAATFPDLAKFALNHNMTDKSPEEVQAKVMGILRHNISQVSRLFSLGNDARRERKIRSQIAQDRQNSLLSRPSATTLLPGAMPVAAIFSFLVGRRSVRP